MTYKLRTALAVSAVFSSLLIGTSAFASGPLSGHPGRMMAPPGVFGTVSAVNGNSITVSSKGFGPNAAETAYTVDAANATVMKNGVSSSVAGIAVGDTVMVEGAVNGTNVTAKMIRDGMAPGMMRDLKPGERRDHATSTPRAPLPQGNGEPVVGGSVTAISGSTLTITNKSNATYTVDASAATVTKTGASSSLANVAVGDSVIVQGSVNGNDVSAASIIDQGAPKTPASGDSSASHPGLGAFFGGIGAFFKGIFGFF